MADALRVSSLVLAVFAGSLVAQDPPPIESGPPAGTQLPRCVAFAPSGPFAGEEFDVAARIGKAPGAILFVHELTRNTGPVIGGLDRLGVLLAWTGLQAHTVRIATDRTDAEIGSKRSSEAMGLARPMLVAVDGADGPGGYALHKKATLTLVTCKDGVVVRSVALTDTGAGDLGKLRGWIEEVTGPVPAEPEALRRAMLERLVDDPAVLKTMLVDLALLAQRLDRRDREARPMQRAAVGLGREAAPGQETPPGRPREGKAPEDEELRALLRRAIQRAADAAELDAVFAAVDARVGADAALRSQAVEMWKLMLSLDYGNDEAKARARAWLAKAAGG